MAYRSATLIGLTLLLVLTGVVMVTTRQSKPPGVVPPELLSHLQLWSSRDSGTYEYTIQRLCECDTRPIRIRVVAGAVVSTAFSATSPPTPSQPYDVDILKGAARTMPQQFEWLKDAYRQNYHKVAVEYDATLGFPSRFYQDRLKDVIDDESDTRIFDVVVDHVG